MENDIEKVDYQQLNWVNGKKHREGGLPAVERASGSKLWYVNGERHREG